MISFQCLDPNGISSKSWVHMCIRVFRENVNYLKQEFARLRRFFHRRITGTGAQIKRLKIKHIYVYSPSIYQSLCIDLYGFTSFKPDASEKTKDTKWYLSSSSIHVHISKEKRKGQQHVGAVIRIYLSHKNNFDLIWSSISIP